MTSQLGQNPIGLYVHVPFCKVKCGYCDFYSFPAEGGLMTAYVDKILEQMKRWGDRLCRPADTLYFGGGTPSLLGTEHIIQIVSAAKAVFLLENAEITLEVNPGDGDTIDFYQVAKHGVNRLSMGLQSAVPSELVMLGRRHTPDDVTRTVLAAKAAGISNISVDVMLGIPGQTEESLRYTLEFVKKLDITHVSAYLLKIEEGTPFYKRRDSLRLPDEDRCADFYLMTCEILKGYGFNRYEISNFCRDGLMAKHNNKYWFCEEYLGLGPAAHSFLEGERFYYDRDFSLYLENPTEVTDGTGGGEEEFIMMTLRTGRGLVFSDYRSRYQKEIPETMKKTAETLQSGGFVIMDDKHISLTDKGAAVSNAVIGKLLA